jgi:hypothetical protein
LSALSCRRLNDAVPQTTLRRSQLDRIPRGRARERLETIEGELAALGGPLDVSTPAELIAAGMPLEKAQAEAAKSTKKAAELEALHRSAREGRDGARFNLNRTVAAHRDELVLGIRPLVTSLVDEARPHAETLAPFAPTYSPGDILSRGDAASLEAWQAAQELERMSGFSSPRGGLASKPRSASPALAWTCGRFLRCSTSGRHPSTFATTA